jgi:hypothetical protein
MTEREENVTYQQLRAPARHGAYTVVQIVQLSCAGLLGIGLGLGLTSLGAPTGVALFGGVLLAGAPVMAAGAVEGREFNLVGLIAAVLARARAPRRYESGARTALVRRRLAQRGRR